MVKLEMESDTYFSNPVRVSVVSASTIGQLPEEQATSAFGIPLQFIEQYAAAAYCSMS